LELIEAVLSALAGGWASGFATATFRQRNRKPQKEAKKEPSPLPETIDGGRGDRALEPLEAKLLDYFEHLSRDAQKSLRAGEKIEIYNFDAGWRLLFEDMFDHRIPNEKVLRDFSVTGHAGLSFGGYDFDTYPNFVSEHLERLESVAGKEHGYKVRFLVLCDRNSENYQQAERFLCELLALKCSLGRSASMIDRFNEWRSNGGDPDIEIRISNRGIAERFAVAGTSADTPFNVYGQRAVSVSVVRRVGRVKPIPHLEIFLNRTVIDAHKSLFDGLWSRSEPLQDRVFATREQEVQTLGSGNLFKQWADLNV
jgi:hypothetical protein